MSNVRYLRVLTELGAPTGTCLSETEIHKQGQWHACVNVCVTDGYGNIYQQCRGGPPYTSIFPGKNDVFLASDHVVDQDEVPEEAVYRALRWRVGIQLSDELRYHLRPVLRTTSIYSVSDETFPPNRHGVQGYLHRAFEYVYVMRLDGLVNIEAWPFPLQSGRVLGVRRYPIARLVQDFRSPHPSFAYTQHVHRTPHDEDILAAIYDGVARLTY